MHGFSIVDVIVDAVKFKGWKDANLEDKILWFVKYPLFLLLFLWVLAMYLCIVIIPSVSEKFKKLNTKNKSKDKR